MIIIDLRSSRPIEEMLTPSIRMVPPAGSSMRNIAKASDDLPAPVRPTIPTYVQSKQQSCPYCIQKLVMVRVHSLEISGRRGGGESITKVENHCALYHLTKLIFSYRLS
jgi:hypothetical protein